MRDERCIPEELSEKLKQLRLKLVRRSASKLLVDRQTTWYEVEMADDVVIDAQPTHLLESKVTE